MNFSDKNMITDELSILLQITNNVITVDPHRLQIPFSCLLIDTEVPSK